METLLPAQVTSEDQREVLRLLCRAHELEVENTELRADSLCCKTLLCQKDLVIQHCHQHLRLCEQLIRGQWQLMQGETSLLDTLAYVLLCRKWRLYLGLENTCKRKERQAHL